MPTPIQGYAKAIAAYAGAQTQKGAPSGEADAAGGFADLVRTAAEGAIDKMRQGESQSIAAVAGKADVTEVVNAVAEADLTLQTVVTVRDRVIEAYKEILRMPM